MDIIELLNEDIFNIISEINKYQFNILTNKSRLDDLIVVDTRFSIIETCKNLIPYLIKKNDETFYVPLDGGEKIYLFNIDIDKSSENNYYITDTILVNTVEESVDYNEYGLPDKKLYKINTIEEIDRAIINFQYCEESCKSELANNINHRCSDLDYKPKVSYNNDFFNYCNKNGIIEINALDDEFKQHPSIQDSIKDYEWLADNYIDPIKSKLKFLLQNNKIGNEVDLISDHVDFQKYLQKDLVNKGDEINYLISAFNMSYLRRFLKSANNLLDNVILAKLKLSNRFKELFVKINNIGEKLVFGINNNFLALIVLNKNTNDIILIPLIDNQGVNKNNISALCLGDTSVKMRVRKLMIKSKDVGSQKLTEGLNINNDDVNFSFTCESLEDFESKLNTYNIEVTTMLQDKNHEGVLEGLACLLCLHSELNNFRLDNVHSVQESKVCDNMIEKTSRLFRETFSKAQKIKPVNFPQYCSESENIQTIFGGDGQDLELNIKKQLRKIIL